MTETQKHDKIMPAIAAAMGQVQKVGKEGRNKHDGYNFASIDDFLALVNPICAANGLVVHMQEAKIEDFARKGKYGENAWLRMTWEISVWHTSGQSLPPVMRTVEVLRNGAQAYGSAQSYALKQFLRSLFLIPTGDKDDADLQPTDAGAVTQAPRQEQRQDAPPVDKPAPRDPVAIANGLIAQIGKAATVDQLGAWPADQSQAAKAWKWLAIEAPDQNKRVQEAYSKRKEELTDAPF